MVRMALTWQDLMRIDSERARDIRVTIVEGMELLGSFDVRLREYAADKLHKQGVHLIKVTPVSPMLDPAVIMEVA